MRIISRVREALWKFLWITGRFWNFKLKDLVIYCKMYLVITMKGIIALM